VPGFLTINFNLDHNIPEELADKFKESLKGVYFLLGDEGIDLVQKLHDELMSLSEEKAKNIVDAVCDLMDMAIPPKK
jgi:hypothetical protein